MKMMTEEERNRKRTMRKRKSIEIIEGNFKRRMEDELKEIRKEKWMT